MLWAALAVCEEVRKANRCGVGSCVQHTNVKKAAAVAERAAVNNSMASVL